MKNELTVNIQPLNIPKSKLKQFLVILGSIIFVYLCLWLPGSDLKTLKQPSFLIIFISLIGILFFGLIGILIIIDFFSFKPALILNENGIINNSHAGGGYLIEWTNIKSMKIKSIGKQKWITFELRDSQKIYNQVNSFTKWWMKINERQFGAPAFIPSILINEKLESVLIQIREYKHGLTNGPKLKS